MNEPNFEFIDAPVNGYDPKRKTIILDKKIINRLGWEGVGASNIWTRALTRSEELSDIGRSYDRFLAGELTLGQLLKRLNQVRKYK